MVKTVIIWLFSGVLCFGQTTQLDKLLSHTAFDHASVGISVRSIASGQEVIKVASDKLFAPASSLKLLTTFVSLSELGKDFRYSTKLAYTGHIENDGTLIGNIVLIGSGDPTFGSGRHKNVLPLDELLSDIIDRIKSFGITCIDGSIISDPYVYAGQNITDEWNYNDIGNYYAGGAWGININENIYKIRFNPSSKQEKTATFHSLEPYLAQLNITSEVIIAGPHSGDNAYIYGSPNQYHQTIRGSIPQTTRKFTIKGAIPNPPLAIAELLYKKLAKENIASQSYTVQRSEKSKTIHTYYSPTLENLIKEANFKSINIYCDALLRTLGVAKTKEGSINAGINAIEKHLKSNKLDIRQVLLKDGSGLAGENKITASLMTEFLTIAQKENGKEVLKFVPRVGEQGTVKNLLNGHKASKNYYLKSGSFEGVQSYSGYLKGKSGKTFSFCFMVNNYTSKYSTLKQQIEKVLLSIYNQT